MTDIASLVFEIDSTQAVQARKNLDDLTKSSEKVETSARKVRTASEQAGIGIGAGNTATERATRSATQHAMALSQAEKVIRGSLHTQSEATAMMLRNAQAQASMAKEAERAATSVQRLTSAYDPLSGEVLKTNRQLAEAQKLFDKGAISASQYAAVTDGLKSKLGNLQTAQATGVKSSTALQNATLNLGRQFTDIGVQLSSGQSPFLVLIQQGPQIADAFAMAKQQGLGFSAVLRGIGASIAPFLPLLAAVGTVATVAFGGAALAARALDKDNKNLASSLGLTEEQMKRLKDKGVDTGVTIGDVFKGTFNYIKGAVAPTLAPVIKWFNELFDNITKGAVITVKAIVGGFAGAFAGVKAIWADLPAVMGDLFASGANLAISAIEKLLNFATAGINSLIEKANAVSGKVGGPQISTLGGFSLGRVDNPNAGAASKTAENAAAAVADAYTKAGAGVDKVFAGIGAEITKAAKARITKAAGDADKSPKAKSASEPRDMSEERSAQIAAQIEQALADELRARLSIAKEISERADLERQIATATASAKQSRIDAQIAAIADDKGLSDLKKAELTLELQRLKFIEGGIADIQRQAINEKERADLAAEALAKAQAERQNQIDLLQSRQSLAQSSYEAAKIEREIVAQRQAMERATLQATIDNATLKESEREVARRRLETLEQIHANERKQLDKTANLLDAMSSAIRAVDDMARAFKSGDIGGGISALSGALKQASGLLGSASGLGKSLGGIADFLGPIGGVVSAVSGLFGGLFGSSKAKKRARAQEAAQKAAEEAQRQQTIADTQFGLDVALLRAQGEELKATNMERDRELARLAALSPALAETQKQLYAASDAAELANQRRSLEIQLMEATGDAAGALAAKRADERAAMDESLRGLYDQINAANDLAAANAAAAQAAKERADFEAGIQAKIDDLALTEAQKRERELAAALAVSDKAGELTKQLWALEDAAAATAGAVEAARQQQQIDTYLRSKSDEAMQAATAAQEAYTSQLSGIADAADRAAHALDDTIKSLTDFADSLKAELGMGTTGGGLEQARRAFNTAVSMGDYAKIQELGRAYADALKSGSASKSEELQGLAAIRQASLNSATSAKSESYQSSLSASLMGAFFKGDQSLVQSILGQKGAGLPGFANGGSLTFGGNPGVDQNVLSLNDQPIANVSYGETAWIGKAGAGPSNDNGNAELIAEVRALRQQVANIEGSAAKAAKHAENLDNSFDNVTEGGTNMRVVAV